MRIARVALLAGLAAAAACRGDVEAKARRMTGGEPGRGAAAIQRHGCGACHAIPGVPGAAGGAGPPLEGIATRAYLGGRLANTPGNLQRWVQHPQASSPGTTMPETGVTDAEARDIAAYLYTLR